MRNRERMSGNKVDSLRVASSDDRCGRERWSGTVASARGGYAEERTKKRVGESAANDRGRNKVEFSAS